MHMTPNCTKGNLSLEAYSFVTNRFRANPNIFPDSPSDGESGEVFGGFGPWRVINQYSIQRVSVAQGTRVWEWLRATSLK